MTYEALDVDKWLYQTLTTDAQLPGLIAAARAADTTPGQPTPVPGVAARWLFADLAPQATPMPYIVYSLHTSSDVRAGFHTRVATEAYFLIKVVGHGDGWTAVQPVIDRLDTLLEQPALLAVQGTSLLQAVTRHQAMKTVEIVENVRVNQVGGIYKFFVSGAA